MIGSTGCFFQGISLAAGLHFQEKSLATDTKVFHFPLDAGVDFGIFIKNEIYVKIEHNFVKLYVKTGTFENIFPIPGSKIQAVFSIEAGTPKILPAAHMYH